MSFESLLNRLSSCEELKDLAPELMRTLSATSSGRSQKEEERYRASLTEWEIARKRYLRSKLRRNVLREVCEANDSSAFYSKEISTSCRIIDAKKTDHGIPLLVVDSEFESPSLSEEDRKRLHDRFESTLFSYCSKLLSIVEGTTANSSLSSSLEGERTYSRIMQLPETIRKEKTCLDSHKEIKDSYFEAKCEDTFHILQSIDMNLTKLASEYRMGSKYQANVSTVEYLSAKFDTFRAKLRMVEYEILSSTYTLEAAGALKLIYKHLKTLLARTQDEIDKAKASLAQYESVGQDFENLVLEYNKLQTDISDKKWALKELFRTQ